MLDWILKRCDGADIAQSSAVGLIPRPGSISTNGLNESVDWQELFSLPKDFWENEVINLEKYFNDQFSSDLPNAISEQLTNLKMRVKEM